MVTIGTEYYWLHIHYLNILILWYIETAQHRYSSSCIQFNYALIWCPRNQHCLYCNQIVRSVKLLKTIEKNQLHCLIFHIPRLKAFPAASLFTYNKFVVVKFSQLFTQNTFKTRGDSISVPIKQVAPPPTPFHPFGKTHWITVLCAISSNSQDTVAVMYSTLIFLY